MPISPRPVSQLSPKLAAMRGVMLSASSLYSPCTRMVATRSTMSSGRMVRRLMVPPTEPSIVRASGALMTSSEAMIAALTSSKLMPPRPCPEPTVDTPLISVRLSFVPRICTPLPTPARRVICTPGMFSSTSARFWSGSLPISSAWMTSTRLSALRSSLSALCSALRIPVTTITPSCVSVTKSLSWTASTAPSGSSASCAWAAGAANAIAVPAINAPRRTDLRVAIELEVIFFMIVFLSRTSAFPVG